MAKIYAPPKEVGSAPEIKQPFDFKAYEKACEEYVQSVKDWAAKNGTGECRGEEIFFGVADGHARYIVFSLSPVKLIYLPVGDAWQFEYAHRLTAKDIKEKVRRRKTISEIFSKRTA